jgi:hypothetical protein
MTGALSAIVAAFAATVALAVSATPASATTYHDKWDYLQFPPTVWPDDVPTCVLTLNGRYHWRAYALHWAHQGVQPQKERSVTLHGRYRWYDWLDVRENDYWHVSILENVKTLGMVEMDHPVTRAPYGDGKYRWESTLDSVLTDRAP